MDFDVRSNFREVEKKLNTFARKQVPFAEAMALNAVGKIVVKGEQAGIRSTFDRPTPFTVNAVGMTRARKQNPEVVIFMKDTTASYLLPYEVGGLNKLNSRALLEPVNLQLNSYGNLPRSKLAQLRARADVFIGKVKTKAGVVEGVWQRMPAVKAKAGRKNKAATAAKPAALKLLIRFADAHPARQHLGWGSKAQALVNANITREFSKALAMAIATAR